MKRLLMVALFSITMLGYGQKVEAKQQTENERIEKKIEGPVETISTAKKKLLIKKALNGDEKAKEELDERTGILFFQAISGKEKAEKELDEWIELERKIKDER